jgi:two-component system, NtrC family, sensor kinase
MILIYHYLALFNALVCVVVAGAVYWRNRYRAVGPLFGLTMLIFGAWLVGFSQYFQPLPQARALWWAKFTLTAAILNYPALFHSLSALVDRMRRLRWWIVLSYVTAVVFLVVLWKGELVLGIRPAPYMNHYIHYNRAWYFPLSAYIVVWQVFGFVLILVNGFQTYGYKRTLSAYFFATWVLVFLTTNAIILPLEYNISFPPVGFFVLPFAFGLLAFVLGKARLADFNAFIARILLQAVMMFVVLILSLLAIGGLMLLAPGFMNFSQIVFTVMLISVIGLVLTAILPPLLPRAEQLMQEGMFGKRYGYQDTLTGLVEQLGHLSSTDELLHQVAQAVHSQMQLTRVAILMPDVLSGEYRLLAQSGLSDAETADALRLSEDSEIVRWLQTNADALVLEEITRSQPATVVARLSPELARLKATVCVPMTVDDQVAGLIALGPKANRERFYASDLKLLQKLATEMALAIKYRRMEEQIFRKNKLIELGTIAAGVAHEIRNPLASIRTFAQLMPDKMDDPEFKNEFSQLVLKDVDRITKVIESMLAFARPGHVTIGEFKAADLVEEAVLLVQPRIKGKRIELTREFHENPLLRVDKQQVLQVLVNLLNNAVDALPEFGKIRVATGVTSLAVDGNGAAVRPFGVIEVADNGAGIPAAIRGRLFDPFFTTKKEGTGLGLSISQKIARDHGGVITVSAVDGKGTSFQLNLPLN